MDAPPKRAFAVDWSGARARAEHRIWVAEAVDGRLVRIENGRTREQVAELLVAEARADPSMVVGLDFAFSFPEWFLRHHGCSSADAFWRLAAREGDRWSTEVAAPFHRGGSWQGDWNREFRSNDPHRKTETELPRRPETVFKLIGPKQVGKASLTGCRTLLALRNAGFSIWPFDPPGYPLAVEIYPRLFYGPVVKSSREARLSFVRREMTTLEEAQVEVLTGSDDAFDAAVSALALDRNGPRLAAMEREPDSVFQLEGRIWDPEPQLEIGSRLSKRLPEALEMALELHGGQTRKGSGAPYVSHLLMAAAAVLENGGDEDEAIAALLHDAVEDQGGLATLAAIDRRFGHRVARIVSGCSDSFTSPKLPWLERKTAFVERLETASPSVLRVVLADKVHNLSRLLSDLEQDGPRVWLRFHGTAEQTLWYYRSIFDVLSARSETAGHPLLANLGEGVEDLARRVQL